MEKILVMEKKDQSATVVMHISDKVADAITAKFGHEYLMVLGKTGICKTCGAGKYEFDLDAEKTKIFLEAVYSLASTIPINKPNLN